jgi:phosphatidylinositol alpha-mannosyltransferase
MKIAIVSDYYYPSLGGITEHVHNQASTLTARGHDVTVVTGRPVSDPPVADSTAKRPAPPFEVVRMGAAVPLFGNGGQTLHTVGVRLGHRLGALFRSRSFDVVHVHAPHNPRMPAWAIDSTPAGTLSVGTFHTVFPQTPARRVQAVLLRRSIARLDGRICVSPACIESLRPMYPFTYDVIPNGVDIDHFSPRASARAHHREHTIAFCGRFDPRNGLALLLAAFASLRSRRPDVELLVIGDGPLAPALRRLVRRADRPAVHWLGRLDLTRPSRLTQASLLCSPCRRASFGMVVLEAMSCGLPVVATRNDGSASLVDDGRTGVLVGTGARPDPFATAIERLLDDPETRTAMGARARRVAVEHYSWERVGDRLIDYYETLLLASPPGDPSAAATPAPAACALGGRAARG